MDRDKFMEVWVEALKRGHMGVWMLAQLKEQFDSKQATIEYNGKGYKAELTWAKCKAKMSYYRKKWKVEFIAMPWDSSITTKSAEQFQNEWQGKLMSAQEGSNERRKKNES
jgi:hypothetical protein